jgi:hypothetical protein
MLASPDARAISLTASSGEPVQLLVLRRKDC